jgi:hypothetical protein
LILKKWKHGKSKQLETSTHGCGHWVSGLFIYHTFYRQSRKCFQYRFSHIGSNDNKFCDRYWAIVFLENSKRWIKAIAHVTHIIAHWFWCLQPREFECSLKKIILADSYIGLLADVRVRWTRGIFFLAFSTNVRVRWTRSSFTNALKETPQYFRIICS